MLRHHRRLARFLILSILVQSVPAVAAPAARVQDAADFEAFHADLEALAMDHALPGLSAAVVRGGEVAWSEGIGFADIERDVLAAPDTRYRLASCSKPLAATIVMQLVDEGRLDLDAPMSDFELPQWFAPDPARYTDGSIRLRHVLSHTSEGEPGESYAYNGNVFVDVSFVLEQVTKTSYPRLLEERIFERAGMVRSSPGHAGHGSTELVELATSYRWDGFAHVPLAFRIMDPDPAIDRSRFDFAIDMPEEATRLRRSWLGDGFSHWNSGCSSSGVVSTVLDLAAFDIALDEGRLVSAEARAAMWAPARTGSGEAHPYGLGWFVQDVEGRRVLWHYGWLPPAVSSLYVKVPDEGLSFVLLSNSDRLSAGVAWGQGGVTASPFARAFLDHFVGEGVR